MNTEKKVAVPEQAEQLKQLGVDQDHSDWVWEKLKGTGQQYRLQARVNSGHPIGMSVVESVCAALDVAELGLALGLNVAYVNNEKGHITSIKKEDFDHPAIQPGNRFFNLTSDLSEAESRAGMLINMIENNLLDIAAINQRLCSKD